MKKIFSLFILLAVLAPALHSQCVNCSGTNSSATLKSSAIGQNTSATGLTSFASGFASEATGAYSTALGFYSFANYTKAVSIGSAIKANADRSMVIGSGSYSLGHFLENNTPRSLVIGFNSINPTLSVKEPLNQNAEFDKTGSVAIGNVVDQYGVLNPLAKLHIKADQEEPAAVLIEPYDWIRGDAASLVLGNEFHGISAVNGTGLIFRTSSSYIFNDGDLVIGREAQPGYVLMCRDESGTVQWTDPSAVQDEDWIIDGGIVYRNGKVGIQTSQPEGLLGIKNGWGDMLTFHLANNPENGYFRIHNPQGDAKKLLFGYGDDNSDKFGYLTMTSEGNIGIGTGYPSSNATLTVDGKVLIGNPQTNLPNNYKLYVEEGIISEKISVKTVEYWVDHIFNDEYVLMPIDELEKFVLEKKHLPDVPTEEFVKREGYNVAEMDAILLKKIEEMSLYLIEQHKENDILKSKINELNKKLNDHE